MSDWNTLHFFDDHTFYSEVAADLKGEGILLRKYLFSDLGERLTGSPVPDSFIDKISAFCKELDHDFQTNLSLQKILRRTRKPEEQLEGFNAKKMQEADDYLNTCTQVIEYLNNILPGIVFSECASYNPHLILGRKIFSAAVKAEPGSISADLLDTIIYGKTDIHSMFNSGIKGWLTHEELQLMWLDKANMCAADEHSQVYFHEFLSLVKTALDKNLGLISITNVNENPLSGIAAPEWGSNLVNSFPGFQYIILRG